MSSYMYAFLVGMCVALERRGDIVSCEAVFNQDPEAGGRIIDASQRLFAKGSVLGLRRTQLEKLFPGVQYSTLDPGAHCEEYMVFARGPAMTRAPMWRSRSATGYFCLSVQTSSRLSCLKS